MRPFGGGNDWQSGQAPDSICAIDVWYSLAVLRGRGPESPSPPHGHAYRRGVGVVGCGAGVDSGFDRAGQRCDGATSRTRKSVRELFDDNRVVVGRNRIGVRDDSPGRRLAIAKK